MTSEVAFTIMISIIAVGVLYMIWWMERQDRKEDEELKKSQQH
jgi:hypothetical protein